MIPGAAAFLNEVYPNPISTYFSDQARPLQLSWAPGPGCASDWHIGDCPGFSAWYPAPRVHDIYIQLCPGDRVEARPRPVCFFHDMLWSRVSSSGLLALEEVVSVPDICNVLPRLSFFFFLFLTNGRKRLTYLVTFAVALTEPT